MAQQLPPLPCTEEVWKSLSLPVREGTFLPPPPSPPPPPDKHKEAFDSSHCFIAESGRGENEPIPPLCPSLGKMELK